MFTRNDSLFSQSLGLPTWENSACTCMCSRNRYGQEIKPEDLGEIEKSEKFLIDKGFKNVRVGCNGNLARIEVTPAGIHKLLNDPLRPEIAVNLKSIAFSFISIDLLGYRTGSFIEHISSDI